MLKLAIPNKGRLAEKSVEVLQRAGIRFDYSNERKLFAMALDGELQVLFLRTGDIPEFVQDGVVDVGITGRDVVEESGKAVEVLQDLGYGKCKLVVAVPEDRGVRTVAGLKENVTIATSFPNLTRRFFDAQGKKVRIVPVTGATEVTPTLGVADAITDLVSTGSTLAMNGLVAIGDILPSSAVLIGNKASLQDKVKGETIREVTFAIRSVLDAQAKRYLMADIPKIALPQVQEFLPGIAGPTVMDIATDPTMAAIHVVVDEDEIYDAVNRLKRLGARGILVIGIDRMVA